MNCRPLPRRAAGLFGTNTAFIVEESALKVNRNRRSRVHREKKKGKMIAFPECGAYNKAYLLKGARRACGGTA